ncbi:MAG: D-Ala-D-Ala carboxypeptidase family metallohydrolase [Synergistaceae bacterium]
MLHPNFLFKLEALRAKWGKPIVINSGYRCSEHNKEVGGVKGSFHRRGLAADVRIVAGEQDEFRELALYFGFTKVLCYPKRNFIHLELGESI